MLTDIQEALRHPKGKLYALFIDYRKAFDLLDRQNIMGKLEAINGKNYLTQIIWNILAANKVTVDDNVRTPVPITQTNGVLQGDHLSPLIFNITTADVIHTLKMINTEATMYMYADDMVLCTTEHRELQTSFNTLIAWADETR